MSFTRDVTIHCDGGCGQWTCGTAGPPFPTVKEARKGARRYGWTYRAGRDLCWRCSANCEPDGASLNPQRKE